jgi:hypothetical protein
MERNSGARRHGRSAAAAGFSQTDTWVVLALVNGARVQSLQRACNDIPASRDIRSSSDGHTWRNGAERVSSWPSTTQ